MTVHTDNRTGDYLRDLIDTLRRVERDYEAWKIEQRSWPCGTGRVAIGEGYCTSIAKLKKEIQRQLAHD